MGKRYCSKEKIVKFMKLHRSIKMWLFYFVFLMFIYFERKREKERVGWGERAHTQGRGRESRVRIPSRVHAVKILTQGSNSQTVRS